MSSNASVAVCPNEEVCAKLGKALASLISSDEGGEVVYRVGAAAFSGVPWCRSAISDVVGELDLLSSDCIRAFSVEARSIMCDTHYGSVDGVISSVVESVSFAQYLSYCDPRPSSSLVCRRLKQMRIVVGELDKLFFTVDGVGASSERRLKDGCDVNWAEVDQLLTRDDLEFGFTFRNPRIMDALKSMESVSSFESSVGRVYDYLGSNLLAMMCCRLVSGDREELVLRAVKSFHLRDVDYVQVVASTRCHYLGDIDENLLPLCHQRPSRVGSVAFCVMMKHGFSHEQNSNILSDRSCVFRYLRDQFRCGPLYRRDISDDYGRPL